VSSSDISACFSKHVSGDKAGVRRDPSALSGPAAPLWLAGC